MIERPAFRNCFHVETVPSEGAFLLSELGHVVLPDRMHELVAPMIDGRRTADAIVEELAREAPPEHVYYTLLDLEKRGLIVDAELAGSIWSYLEADPRAARARVEATEVQVLAMPGLDAEPLASALRAHGLAEGPRADFTLALTADYLEPELERVDADARRRGRPWMLVNPFAATALLGPIFKPGETGCWECLAARLRANRDVEAYLESRGKKGRSRCGSAALAALTPATMALAAFQAARFVALGENRELEGRVVSLDLSRMVTTTHHLVRRPQCPACGDAGYLSRTLAPVRMEPRPKRFTADGGHRAASPAETFTRYQHHVSPLTGIVRGLAAAPAPGGGLPNVYVAGHNFAMKADSLHFLRQHLRVKSCGKGVSEIQARTSALCEAIERYSGLFSDDRPRRRASLEELGEAGVHPNLCMGFSDRQYATRQDPTRLGSPFHAVPRPFDPTLRIDWTPVWSFRTSSFRYLPTSYCYYGYPSPPDAATCWADSNGCAAGGTLEEAALQGFLELVERDAVAIWWYNRLPRPGVDLDSFQEPYVEALRRSYASLGRELWVLDVGSDLEIPTFAAVSRRIDQRAEDILFGFGTHLDARVALLRALTEMNQFLPAVSGPAVGGAGPYGYGDQAAIAFWQTATLENQPYLAPEPGARPRCASDYAPLSSDDLRDDVALCIGRAEQLGMETLLLDQTLPDVGLRVVKVIVPGMRHFWARFAPGRLYDVPVKMGWLPRPLREEELNPISMFL